MKQEQYDAMIAAIEKKYKGLKPNKRVGVPVPILIQEAENLYHWCQPDKAALKKAGLDWELVKDIPARVNIVQDLEAQWFIARKTKNSAKSDYLTALKECRALCAELVRDFRFAMSDTKNAMEYLAQYNKYRKNIEVSFDLRALAALGKKHTPLLEKINFDLSLLDRADAMGKDLMNKSSEDSMNIDKSRLHLLYNKACHYLKDAVSEIRRCGKYVFHGNKERLIGYRSEYRRLHKTKKVS